jgi:hypothetical protein
MTAGKHLAGQGHASPTATSPRVITHQAPPATNLDEASYQPQPSPLSQGRAMWC